MGIHHTTGNNPRSPIVPDGFLDLGVEQMPDPKGRGKVVTWRENDVVPIFCSGTRCLERDLVWLSEWELGLGRGMGTFRGCYREWLFWFDRTGQRPLSPDEIAKQERQ